MNNIKRGDIVKFAVPLDENSNIIGGYRPWLVVQNNKGNAHSDTTIVVPITGSIKRLDLPTHVPILWGDIGPSTVLCEQVRTVDIRGDWKKVGTLPPQVMTHVDQALMMAFFAAEGGAKTYGVLDSFVRWLQALLPHH